MNPDDPSEPHLIPVGDAELEARIVAWVLGEASAFEAAELERLCEETPELRLFEQRIRSLHSLVKEDFHPLPGEAWRLPAEKREKVTALFGDLPAPAESERQRKVNRYFTRRALLATAACLAVTAAVSWPYFSRERHGVAGEKGFAGAAGGNEMSPEQQQRYYEELRKAVKTQEDAVEDKRQALQTIIRTQGIVYNSAGGGSNAAGERHNSTNSDAIKQSSASASFEDAQEAFAQEQRILESLKLKQIEVGMQAAVGERHGEVALRLADAADSKSASALAAEVPGRESGGDVLAGRFRPADMPALARSDERKAKVPAAPVFETLPPPPPPAEVPAGLAILDQSLSDVGSSDPLQSRAGGGSGGGSGGGLGSGSGTGHGSNELFKRSKAESQAGGSTDYANAPSKDLAMDSQSAEPESAPRFRVGSVNISGNTKAKDSVIRKELPLKPGDFGASPPEATATHATGIVTRGLRSGSGEIGRNNIDAVLNNPGSTTEKDVAPGVVALNGQFNDAFADSADALQMPQGAASDDLYGQSHLKPSEVGFGYIMRGSSDDGRRAGGQNDGPMTYTGFGLSSLGRAAQQLDLSGQIGDVRYFDDPSLVAQQPDLTKEYADHYILAGAEYRLRDSDVISAPLRYWGGDAVPDLVGTLEYRNAEPDYATGVANSRFKSWGYNELESLKSPQDFLFPPLPNSLPNPAQQELKSPHADPAPEKPKEPDLKEISAADEAFSTFSLHVSDVSFRLAKAALDRGERPDPASIREEEFYNAVEYGDPATAKDEPVACVVEQSAHPVRPQRDLVRIGIRTGSSGRAAATPLNLVLLLDSSGSMERDDRHAGLVKAVQELSSLLKDGDTITVVGFSRKPRLLADRLPGKDAAKLNEIIANSPIEGGTDLAQGLKLAGELAERQFLPKAQNRVVLFTDGAANLGDADPQSLAKMIVEMRGKHIAFDAAGFGAEGLNDKLLEQLTRDGDGRYYVVNRPEDAGDQFAKQLAGAFRPAAENVKVQVRLNAARVGKYRLTGFAEHRLQTEDFHNDSVDAAEMAAEEAGNALYEVEPLPEGEGEIGEVSVRFRNAATGEMVERTWTIPYEPQSPAFDKARPSMQLAGLALLTAEKLQGGAAADAIDFNTMATVMASVRQVYGSTAGAAQLLEMIGKLR
jgi:Mg-chelatase subunit ChlD